MREVFAVTAFARWLARSLGRPGLLCRAVDFLPDGRLALAFSCGGARATVCWGIGPRGGFAVPGIEGRFAWTGRPRPAVARRVVDALAGTLPGVLRDYAAGLFAGADPGLREAALDGSLVPRLFAGALTVGRTRHGPFRLAAVEWDGEQSVALAFESALRALRFVLAPVGLAGPAPGTPVAAQGPLALYLVRDDRTAAERRNPEHRVERFLSFLLHRRVADGLRLVPRQNSVPLGSTFLWGDDLRYQFFCEKEHDCLSLMHALFGAGDGFRFVGDGDRECLNQFPFVRDPIEHTIVSRWYAADRVDSLAHFHSTDFNDERTILGGSAEVRRLVRGTGREYELVYHACLPLMIGDTFRPELPRAGRRGAPPQLVCEMDVHNLYFNLQKFWRTVVEYARGLPRTPGVSADSVALIGFGRTGDPDLAELERWLATLGISVAAKLLPSFDAAELPRLFPAARFVIVDDELTVNAFAEAAEALGRPVDRLPAPFGMAGTKRWFLGLARLFGRERAAARSWRRWQAEVHDAWASLTTAARGRRVALVAGTEQLGALGDPRSHFGIDLPGLLDEMGFGIDLLVHDPRGDGAARAAALLPGGPGRHAVATFRDFPGLRRLLDDGAFSLVYSEIYRDRRVVCAGKLPFDLTAFRMAPGGAVASLRRLLARCDVPFYRNYRRFLGAP